MIPMKKQENTKRHVLPSARELFKQSFTTFKRVFVRYVLWQVLSLIVLAVVGAVIFLGYATGFTALLGNMTVIPILFFFVLTLLLVPVFIYAASAQAATTILVVADEEKKTSLSDHIKHGFKKTPLILGTALITLFFMGSWFLFIIPGFYISFCLSFVIYEILFNDQRVWAAIKNSVTIWQHNFKTLFSLTFLFGFVSWIPQKLFEISDSFFPEEPSDEQLIVMLVIFIIEMLVYTCTSLLAIAASYHLYTAAKTNTPKTVTPSLRWFWITSVLGWIIATTLIILGINYMRTEGKERLEKWAKEYAEEQVNEATPLTQADVDYLSTDTFALVNEQLTANGKKELVQDPMLCNYTRVRLDEITANGGIYDSTGFTDKLENNIEGEKYFKGYLQLGELYYPRTTSLETATDLSNFYDENAKKQSIGFLDGTYRGACITGKPGAGFLFVVGK